MGESSKINKRGGSNKGCSWENFLKKNRKNSMLIREFRVMSLKAFLNEKARLVMNQK